MCKKLSLLEIVLWSWSLAVSAIAWPVRAEIAVSTLGIDMTAAPGAAVHGSFTVINAAETAARVRIKVADFVGRTDGSIEILPAGTAPYSLAPFVAVTPAEFALPGGKGRSQAIKYTVALPPTLRGPHWSLLLVEEVSPGADPPAASPGEKLLFGTIAFRYGVQLRQTDPADAINKGKILHVGVERPGHDIPLRVILEYWNAGGTFQQVKGELRITDARGQILRNVPVLPFRVLPGGKRRLELVVSVLLPPGKYIGLGILDFGGDYLIAGEVRFQVP